MKPRAGQNQIRSPCPRALRAPARPHVRLSDTPRTGRAAEDVGPYHPSCPDAARRAKDPRRPRRGTSKRARRAKYPRRPRCRAFVADEVADEAARKPASKPFSVSPCLPALRVNRPEARSPVRSLSDTPRTGRAAEDVGPYHPSCPDAARRAKDSRRPRRVASPGGRVAIHCDRGRRASCRSTRSARRHEGTEEVESWFTHTAVTFHRIP